MTLGLGIPYISAVRLSERVVHPEDIAANTPPPEPPIDLRAWEEKQDERNSEAFKALRENTRRAREGVA